MLKFKEPFIWGRHMTDLSSSSDTKYNCTDYRIVAKVKCSTSASSLAKIRTLIGKE